MKIKDLIDYLSTLDPDKKIGFIGHFGEFVELQKHHLGERKVIGWKLSKPAVIEITPPDFGPEPD